MDRRPRGAIAIWAVLVVAVLLAFVALGLNAGHLASVKGELQNGVDSAALAGALQLDGTVDQIDTSVGAISVAEDFAAYHYTDKPGKTQIEADEVVLGNWRSNKYSDCESSDRPTPYHDSPTDDTGHRFCEVTARDAAAARRINAVYVRAQRAADRPGGGPVSVFMSAFLGGGSSGAVNQGAEAIAISGGPCESTCLRIPLVTGVGCIAGSDGSAACAADAPKESNGPIYPLEVQNANERSAGWSTVNPEDPLENPVRPKLCAFLQDTQTHCRAENVGTIQVDTDNGERFQEECKGDGKNKMLDWFVPLINQEMDVPLVSRNGDLTGSPEDTCPKQYNGNYWVVGTVYARLLAVCSDKGNAGDSSQCSQCTHDCVVMQVICNHRSTAKSTGCAWAGTSTFHPVLVQTRGASN